MGRGRRVSALCCKGRGCGIHFTDKKKIGWKKREGLKGRAPQFLSAGWHDVKSSTLFRHFTIGFFSVYLFYSLCSPPLFSNFVFPFVFPCTGHLYPYRVHKRLLASAPLPPRALPVVSHHQNSSPPSPPPGSPVLFLCVFSSSHSHQSIRRCQVHKCAVRKFFPPLRVFVVVVVAVVAGTRALAPAAPVPALALCF